MRESHLQFDKRLHRLGRKHQAMAQGYTTHLRSDGLIVAKPLRVSRRLSAKPALLFIAAFFLFKGFLLASLGPDAYGDRIGRLQSGTFVEQAGAWVMQAEPVSQLIARQIGPVLR
jgi:hypothetical protein